MAVGNRLVITSNDPEALAFVREVVRVLTAQGSKSDFEVIKLKNAGAAEAAKVLDEAFNGPKQPAQNLNPFFGRFGMQGATPPANPTENRVRVVADPTSNSLIVWASPLDMLKIRQLLDKAIDSSEPINSTAVARSWIIPLKYADATEVASTIRDAYREYMNQDAVNAAQRGGFRGPRFGGGGPFGANVNPDGTMRTIALSVGVDERSNRLILVCSEKMKEDIQLLVNRLDEAAKDSTRTVQVVPVKGIDPALVQQAIDAIYGRSTNNNQRGGMGNGFRGFGGGGFGGPGFRGGGGFGGGGGGFGGGGGPGGNRGGRPGGMGRGPDFFDDRVKDDPQPSLTLLYDPQRDRQTNQQTSTKGEVGSAAPGAGPAPSAETAASNAESGSSIQLARADEEQQQSQSAPSTPGIEGLRSNVTAEALSELGAVIITAQNRADFEIILQVIRRLQELAKESEVRVQMVPVTYGDPTFISNILTQLYQRVVVGPGGNIRTQNAPTPTTITNPFGGSTTTAAQQNASVVLIPMTRFGSILVAAPNARIPDIVAEIKRLDHANSPKGRAIPFPLKKALASRVDTLLTGFYASRYPNETAAQHEIRFTHDDTINTLWVQASPADLAEIEELIHGIDTNESKAINDVRIVLLHNATSDELASLLQQAIQQGAVTATAATTTGAGGIPAAAGGVPGGALGGAFGAAALGGARAGLGAPTTGAIPGGVIGGAPGLGAAAAPAATAGGITMSGKGTTLRFVTARPGARGAVESGLLEDIRITSDARINSLIIEAPERTMNLLLALIRDLDVAPAAHAEIKVFTLHNADATFTAGVLQQLFLGTGTPATPTAGIPTGGAAGTTGAGGGAFGGAGGAGAFGGAPGGAFGAAGGAAGGVGTGTAFAGAVGLPRAAFTLGGTTPEGAPLVPLSFTVDTRTNSIVIAGAPKDLDVITVLVSRLEDAPVDKRESTVYHLRNASAADVSTALQTFWTQSLSVLASGQQLSYYQEVLKNVIIIPEPITNTLLISATPKYYAEVMRLIEQLDAQPPQVVIQVLIAEVDLTSTEEFGVEIGLQSPVLFSRSIIPAPNGFGTGTTINYSSATGGLVPAGTTVTSSINPTTLLGTNFNNPSIPLGNNPLANPAQVGFQGLGSLGVGRTNSNGLGGFVFSAASDTFNLLIRALKTQGRIDILSRPQIQTMDNQTALLNVGQDFPYITGQTVTATGLVTNGVAYRPIGVILQVTPRISPDGTVIMRIIPEISSLSTTSVSVGTGVTASAFNTEHFETTVVAEDGQTVAIGGLITKRDEKDENKIPWLGDLPGIGALFRYRTQSKNKLELLVIMTPHIVRSRLDADHVLAAESRRMDWVLGDVIKAHGTTGLEPIMPPSKPSAPVNIDMPDALPPEAADGPIMMPSLSAPATSQPADEMLPHPRKMPPGPQMPPAKDASIPPTNSAPMVNTQTPTAAEPAALDGPVMDDQRNAPVTEEKRKWWNVFQRKPWAWSREESGQ
jgi:type II secretion system protein D